MILIFLKFGLRGIGRRSNIFGQKICEFVATPKGRKVVKQGLTGIHGSMSLLFDQQGEVSRDPKEIPLILHVLSKDLFYESIIISYLSTGSRANGKCAETKKYVF